MKPIEQQTLYGFNEIFKELTQIYKENNLPNKILISGKKGIGKSTFSYHLINYILSKNEKNCYDLTTNKIHSMNRSFVLLNKKSHPNFYKIKKKKDKKAIDISQIRDMYSFINKSAFNSGHKIVMIDGVEDLSNPASNSLLKVIEEPNKNVLFILIYDSSKKLFDTIKSRCIEFKLSLEQKYIKEILLSVCNEDIYANIHKDYKNSYLTPYYYLSLINLCNEHNFDLQNTTIENLLKVIITDKLYRNQQIDFDNLKLYLEIFFLKKFINLKDINIFKISENYNDKISKIIKFNLDIEPIFIELYSKYFNEK